MDKSKSTSARDWAARWNRRRQIRRKLGPRKARHNLSRPKVVKPAAFYVSPSIDRCLFRNESDAWRAFYLLNQIHMKGAFWRQNEAGYVQLACNLLVKVMGPGCIRRIKDQLLDAGIIETDRLVAAGKALGYRIRPLFQNTERIVCPDERFNRRIAAVYAEQERHLLPVHRWLQSSLLLIDCDFAHAARIIDTLVPDEDSELSVEEYRQKARDQVRRLADKEFYLIVDAYGRVHTNLTNLPKQLRQCLSVAGQPLACLDLFNSQPLIAGLVARAFYGSPATARRLIQARFANRSRAYAARVLEGMRAPGGLPSDVIDYIQLCSEGTIYESFGMERAKAKKALLTVFYGPNKFSDAVKDAFALRYPSMALMFAALKQREYERAAWIMQNREAAIFIREIAGRVMRDSPNLPVYTIQQPSSRLKRSF